MKTNDEAPELPKDKTEWMIDMSLRDWFAGMALQGLVVACNLKQDKADYVIAKNAYIMADAMIAERNKTNE